MGRVELHLRIKVKPEREPELRAFLAEAIPFYERPGGIRVRLLACGAEPGRFIELVEYASEEAFERDQQRVENDPEQRAYLARWRAILDGPPVVEVYRETAVLPGRPVT